VFEEWFHTLRSPNPNDALLYLLLLTSTLERALGDVYLSVSGASCCPSLLKDLLCTKELEQTFGRSAIWSLKAMIGPPVGFNLRNVAWHGFLSAGEIRHQFVSFLLIITAALGQTLLSDETTNNKVHHRCPVSYSDKMTVIRSVITPIHAMETKSIIDVIMESEIVPPQFKSTCCYSIGLVNSER
jgi:hypothetical protein